MADRYAQSFSTSKDYTALKLQYVLKKYIQVLVLAKITQLSNALWQQKQSKKVLVLAKITQLSNGKATGTNLQKF